MEMNKKQPSAEPAPVMLHEDATFKQPAKTSDFHLARPGDSSEVRMDSVRPQQLPTRPAVLELGKTPAAGTPQTRVVHYTEFKSSPLSSVPSANSGPRNLTEITTPGNVPVAPKTNYVPVPVPPPPSKPPIPPPPQPSTPTQTPPAPPQGKVIVKDFLDKK